MAHAGGLCWWPRTSLQPALLQVSLPLSRGAKDPMSVVLLYDTGRVDPLSILITDSAGAPSTLVIAITAVLLRRVTVFEG